MNDINTYIFVHDQNIILDFEKSKKFNHFSNWNYVFVGNNPIDLISCISNVIIARNLPYNLEAYPKFTAFTGWYALWKNNLITSKYVNLFEYDVMINKDFQIHQENKLMETPDFIGYVPVLLSVFWQQPHWIDFIAPYIDKFYNINIHEIVDQKISEDEKSVWSSTSNSTFSIENFNEYMIWFEKFIGDLKSDALSGFAFEISLCFFHFIFNKKVVYMQGIVNHYMLGSHNNIPRFNAYYKELLITNK